MTDLEPLSVEPVVAGAATPTPRATAQGHRCPSPPHNHAYVRSGLYVPVFDELADPLIVARLSAEAEEAGWHGVFVWDQVRWREPVLDVADPWITLAATSRAPLR